VFWCQRWCLAFWLLPGVDDPAVHRPSGIDWPLSASISTKIGDPALLVFSVFHATDWDESAVVPAVIVAQRPALPG